MRINNTQTDIWPGYTVYVPTYSSEQIQPENWIDFILLKIGVNSIKKPTKDCYPFPNVAFLLP